MKKILINFGISFCIIIYIFFITPFEDIIFNLYNSSLTFIFFSSIIGLFSLFFNALRWNELLKIFNININIKSIFSLTLIGFFFNVFMPGGILGDVTKGYLLNKQNLSENKISYLSATIVFDRIIGIISLIALSLLGFLKYYIIMPLMLKILITIFFITSCFLLSIFFYKKSFRFILIFADKILKKYNFKDNFINILNIIANNPFMTIKAFVHATLSNICMIFTFYFAGISISVFIDFLYYLYFIPLIEFCSALPISINGIGVREFLMILLFKTVNVDIQKSVAISFIIFFNYILYGLIGYLLYYLNKQKNLL